MNETIHFTADIVDSAFLISAVLHPPKEDFKSGPFKFGPLEKIINYFL